MVEYLWEGGEGGAGKHMVRLAFFLELRSLLALPRYQYNAGEMVEAG